MLIWGQWRRQVQESVSTTDPLESRGVSGVGWGGWGGCRWQVYPRVCRWQVYPRVWRWQVYLRVCFQFLLKKKKKRICFFFSPSLKTKAKLLFFTFLHSSFLRYSVSLCLLSMIFCRLPTEPLPPGVFPPRPSENRCSSVPDYFYPALHLHNKTRAWGEKKKPRDKLKETAWPKT